MALTKVRGLIEHSAMPSGSILQVIESVHTGADGTDTFTSNTSFSDSGHSLTITPKFSTSKVFVTLLGGRMSYGGSGAGSQLFVQIQASVAGGSYSAIRDVMDEYQQHSTYGDVMAGSVLHSPNTTSAVIYKTQFKSGGQNAAVYYTSSSNPVVLTAMEIAG